jgi:hypothetical protein
MKIEIPKEVKSLKRKYRYKEYFKDKLWSAVSSYVVKRDEKKYGGRCIVCKMKLKLQAGHFAPASNCGFDLLFDENNIHGECEYDNGFNAGHLIGYKTGLIERYGEDFVNTLEKRYNDSRYKGITKKEYTKLEYIEKCLYFIRLEKEL